jgi:gliding motility-associated-like protein
MTQLFQATGSSAQALAVASVSLLPDSLSLPAASLCHTLPALQLGNDTVVCGSSALLLQDVNGSVFDQYLWSTGETTASITVQQAGTYALAVSDTCGWIVFRDTVTVSLLPSVDPGLDTHAYLCEDSLLLLQAPSCDSCLFSWSNGSSGPDLVVTEGGIYWLTVESPGGCAATDTLAVAEVPCECTLYLPTAFTPNHDGRNEVFGPVYHCDASGYIFQVFDRWGRLLFESDNPSAGWNGMTGSSAVAPGLYPYRLLYTPLLKGLPGTPVVKTGTVTVVY